MLDNVIIYIYIIYNYNCEIFRKTWMLESGLSQISETSLDWTYYPTPLFTVGPKASLNV